MPASQTITAFYSFTPSTAILSAQVNNNFNLFRGHLLPIDGSAASFANNSYDLGSTSASWRNTYSTNMYLGASGTLNLLSSSITTFTFPATSGKLALSVTPTVQVFDSAGSGTYTTPANCKYIIVEMCAGGGGGGGNGSGPGAGSDGGATSFGSATCTGGVAGPAAGGSIGGAGGTNTLAYTTLVSAPGQYGQPGFYNADGCGGAGGNSPFAGGGYGGQRGSAGAAPGGSGVAPGGGGGGGGGTSSVAAGPGGGSGAYQKFLISSPASTYSYAVGAGGTLGSAGGGGNNGGSGFKGIIIVTEYY